MLLRVLNSISERGFRYVVMLAIFISLFSCAKKRAFNDETASEATDFSMFSTETEAAIEDIQNIISNQFLLRGKGASEQGETATLCGGTVDTSKILGTGIVTLNYNSQACKGRKREGFITVKVMDYPVKKWKQKGCSLKVDFNGYKISNTIDGRIIKIDGTLYLTNESGSSWYEMRYLNTPSVTYSVSGNNLKLTVSNNYVDIVSLSRRVKSVISGTVITNEITGLAVQDGNSDVDCWGVNSDGKSVARRIISTLAWNTRCGPAAPVYGETWLNVADNDFLFRTYYGASSDGSAPDGSVCPSNWKIEWAYKKNVNKRVFNYPF